MYSKLIPIQIRAGHLTAFPFFFPSNSKYIFPAPEKGQGNIYVFVSKTHFTKLPPTQYQQGVVKKKDKLPVTAICPLW
jgi:hypothetical protein